MTTDKLTFEAAAEVDAMLTAMLPLLDTIDCAEDLPTRAVLRVLVDRALAVTEALGNVGDDPVALATLLRIEAPQE